MAEVTVKLTPTLCHSKSGMPPGIQVCVRIAAVMNLIAMPSPAGLWQASMYIIAAFLTHTPARP